MGVRVTLAMSVALALAAATSATALTPGPTALVIGDKTFTESRIVARLYGEALKARGFAVEYQGFITAPAADEAARAGAVQLYPEYTGTALSAILGERATTDGARNFRRVRARYAARGLTALGLSPYSNDNRVACRRAVARRRGLRSLADLEAAAPSLVYSANARHLARPDGYPLLRGRYDIRFGRVITVPLDDRYRAVTRRTADCVYAFGTDAQIDALDLEVMRDPRGLFSGVPYANFGVVNAAWLAQADPAARGVIVRVSKALTGAHIRRLNAQVDLRGADAERVARAFLRRQKLVPAR